MNIKKTIQGSFSSGYLGQYIENNYTFLSTIFPFIFFSVILAISLSVRKIGNYGVETDFFWAYLPQAKSFLAGNLTVDGFRGPVYSIVLGLFYLVFRNFFVAGIIISALSASIVLFFTARIITLLSNIKVGSLVVIFLAINPVFIQYSYTCGTDMFFNALVSTAIFYYLKQNKYSISFLIIIGLLGGIIYLTRSNGLFILIVGLFILFDSEKEALSKRILNLLIFLSSFIVVILPWSFYCYLVKGSFFYDKNYLNIAFEIYNKGALNREEFWFGNNQFNSIIDVIKYKPIIFIKSFLTNTYENFSKNLDLLVGLHIGIFFLLGILLKLRTKLDKIEAKYFIFNLSFFILLSLIFYDQRFSLFLIPFYLYLALNIFYGDGKSLVNYWPKDIVAIIVTILFVWTLIISLSFNMVNIDYGPKEVLKIKDKFKEYVQTDVSNNILASRKPYLAYELGLNFHVIPFANSLQDMLKSLRQNKVDYLYWGGDEKISRPGIFIPLDGDSLKNLGLEKIFSSDDNSSLYKILYNNGQTKTRF